MIRIYHKSNNIVFDYSFSGLKYFYDDTVTSNYPKSTDSKIKIIRERSGFEGVRCNIILFWLALNSNFLFFGVKRE